MLDRRVFCPHRKKPERIEVMLPIYQPFRLTVRISCEGERLRDFFTPPGFDIPSSRSESTNLILSAIAFRSFRVIPFALLSFQDQLGLIRVSELLINDNFFYPMRT